MTLFADERVLAFYDVFASYYDRLRADAHIRARRYLQSSLPDLDGQGRLVFDLGCGTGAISSQLFDARWMVVGYDASEEMLRVAKERCRGCRFERADLRQLPAAPPSPAHLAICFGDTLNHLIAYDDWIAVFKQVARRLATGALFLFDVLTPFDHHEVWPDSLEVAEHPGCVLVVRGGYDEAQQRAWLRHTWFLEATTHDGPPIWVRSDRELHQTSVDEATLHQSLTDTGFTDITILDGDTCASAVPTSTRWFIQCRRSKSADL